MDIQMASNMKIITDDEIEVLVEKYTKSIVRTIEAINHPIDGKIYVSK